MSALKQTVANHLYMYLGISDKCRVIPSTSGLIKDLNSLDKQLSKFCLLDKCQFGLVSKVRHLHTQSSYI